MARCSYYSRQNVCVGDLTQTLIECESGQVCIRGKPGAGKTTTLQQIARSLLLVERFSRHIFWLHVGKIENVMELLTLVGHIGHEILFDVFGESENNYRPDNIEDWLMYIKSNSPISEIVLFLDGVCDQFVVDVFAVLKIRLVISTENTDLQLTNACASLDLDDFSEVEARQFISQILPSPTPTLPPSMRTLLRDLSRSPLELTMVGYLINSSGGGAETLEMIIDDIISKRGDIASAMIHQQTCTYGDGDDGVVHTPMKATGQGRSPSTSPLLTRVMPRLSSATASGDAPDLSIRQGKTLDREEGGRDMSDSTKTTTWWEDQMRRVSIYITLQLVLETLPENVQVKYVLLGIVPSGQPISINLLRFLWKCENEKAVLDVVAPLLAAGLLRVDKHIVTQTSIDAEPSPQLFILHTLQHDYLADLLSLEVWRHRVQLAGQRLAEYVTDPSLRSEEDMFFQSLATQHCSRGVSSCRSDGRLMRPPSVICRTVVRLGLYCRKV